MTLGSSVKALLRSSRASRGPPGWWSCLRKDILARSKAFVVPSEIFVRRARGKQRPKWTKLQPEKIGKPLGYMFLEWKNGPSPPFCLLNPRGDPPNWRTHRPDIVIFWGLVSDISMKAQLFLFEQQSNRLSTREHTVSKPTERHKIRKKNKKKRSNDPKFYGNQIGAKRRLGVPLDRTT